MAGSTDDLTPRANFYLSPGEQDLLLAALNSNQVSADNNAIKQTSQESQSISPSNGQAPRLSQQNSTPSQQSGLPTEQRMSSLDSLDDTGPTESPYLDFDPELDFDANFDFDDSALEGQMIGGLPEGVLDGEVEHETHDKRKSPGDEHDEEEGGGKRREGGGGRKPGRKPLTSEPTTKRKAQNRAAQRAFRERKEKHLKDLEIKVADLEKASDSANQENGILRAQVDRLSTELREYRKRLSSTGMPVNRSPTLSGSSSSNVSRTDNFQFEFPSFGHLPGAHIFNNGSLAQQNGNKPTSPPAKVPGVLQRNSQETVPTLQGDNRSSLPELQTISFITNGNDIHANGNVGSSGMAGTSKASSASPQVGLLNSSGESPIHRTPGSVSSHSQHNGSSHSSMTSPATSAGSQHGAGSSCGTSPEPSTHSPANGKMTEQSLNTIKENEEPNIFGGSGGSQSLSLTSPTYTSPGDMSAGASTNFNGIDWLAQQNGGQFDPVLFGDYREPQDAITTGDFGAYFSEAFPLPDLGSPFGDGISTNPLDQQIQTQPSETSNMVTPTDFTKLVTAPGQVDPVSKALGCTAMWDRLQSSPAFQSGDLDIDGLCGELKKKARCSESGVVVAEKDLDAALAECPILSAKTEEERKELTRQATLGGGGGIPFA
ncbi:MAG: DNA-binding transcription factor yap1 [Caeruleum heppii]|nr:MAG: DNA-binding transcription factor yap1 [Caeruleum heppii]